MGIDNKALGNVKSFEIYFSLNYKIMTYYIDPSTPLTDVVDKDEISLEGLH